VHPATNRFVLLSYSISCTYCQLVSKGVEIGRSKTNRHKLRSSCIFLLYVTQYMYLLLSKIVQCVPLATEPGISLIILPLMRILQRNLRRTTDTFLFLSHTTNVLLFKFRCNIFIGVRIIKEMPGSVASGTHCTLPTHEHNMPDLFTTSSFYMNTHHELFSVAPTV